MPTTSELAHAVGDAVRLATVGADPVLSKFTPLPRILTLDGFTSGLHGWVELGGNYDGHGSYASLDRHFRDFRPPQLSSCDFFDVGTHGAMTGTYALKLATRQRPGHTATAIRRLTMSGRGLLQIEAYLAFKTEANLDPDAPNTFGEMEWDGNNHPSEAQFGAFTVATDLCGDGGIRYHNVARYENADADGRLVRRWAYPVVPEPTPREHWQGRVDHPLDADFTAPDPNDWRRFEEPQELCVNEVPTKVNWHYLRFLIDTEQRRNVEVQLNDRVMDWRDVPVPVYADRYGSLENLLNVYFSVRTLSGRRNFLFLDSVLISANW